MKLIYYRSSLLFAGLLLANCGAYLNQPVGRAHAKVGELTLKSKFLKDMPKPTEPVVAGVYNFRDQTGQYKNIETGSSFSTAISQGGTAILTKALEDSGWFTVVERENLGNLLNERNIINTTRDQFRKAGNETQTPLPPLLFAGVLLEGGVISYDSNIRTGGSGARYFGVGGATQYREDRLTVYLRAVSTTNGKVLKTVYVSKTILSQAISANLFKYVNFQRLLEVETGFTVNEPIQLAVKEAIEKAVEGLIIEGIEDELWKTNAGVGMDRQLVAKYNEEKSAEEMTLLYGRKQLNRNALNEVDFAGGVAVLDGDLGKKKPGYSFRLGYTRWLNKSLGLNLNANPMQFVSGSSYRNQLYAIDLNVKYNLLPDDVLSPQLYGGFGYVGDYFMFHDKEVRDESSFKMQYGMSLNYNLSDSMALFVYGEHHLSFDDTLDGIKSGKRKDYYYNLGFGLKYYF
ncbi:CsgG/HfaB family protein [Flavobacterium sp. JP2137]|uniref:CsgG/HfaB family protein n=1 Tax=Flavobacterium sp. JP2137 TaxID=3414510 RepID=UPI003D2FE143